MTKKLFMLFAMWMPLASLAQTAVVRIESGLVKGIDQEGSIGFLGIPYAKVERFMPPQPVDKWEGIRVCDHWGPQAMQNTWGRKLSEAEMSEQCCVLNVWTTSPLTQVKESKDKGQRSSPSWCGCMVAGSTRAPRHGILACSWPRRMLSWSA